MILALLNACIWLVGLYSIVQFVIRKWGVTMPNYSDLDYWLRENHRQVWDAIHYLHMPAWMDCALLVWERAGKPNIEIE